MSMVGPEDTAVHRLAVVGGGPRATYALERLSATLGRLGGRRLQVRVFERSGEFGSGETHSPSQPRTSFLNRISGQVSFAADETMKDAGPLRTPEQRPTLHEWCRTRFTQTGHPDLDLGPEDWPRRYVHGLALRHMFEHYLDDLRACPGVQVLTHAVEVVRVERTGEGFGVHTAEGRCYGADQVLVVTGHTSHAPERSARTRALAAFAAEHDCVYVPYGYPLDLRVPRKATGRSQMVGIAGMGLTAIDEILHLTEGRGGVFAPDEAYGLRYLPSGDEPAALVAFSETGLFTFARPDNHKDSVSPSLEHRGVFLTCEAVDRLRASVGTPAASESGRPGVVRQLDFERDVLPLIVLEMAYVHYLTLFGPEFGARLTDRTAAIHREFLAGGPAHQQNPGDPCRLLGVVERTVSELATALETVTEQHEEMSVVAERAAGMPVEAALRRWTAVMSGGRTATGLDQRPGGNRFSWRKTLAPLGTNRFRDGTEYREAVLTHMARDRSWAQQGNLDNPHKAAADGVWRDLRGVVSHAVDHGGLTPASHRVFLNRYVRVHNRLANGAASEVMARVEALVRHGILDVAVGPGCKVIPDPATGRFRVDGPATRVSRQVDTLLDARVHPFSPERDTSPLYRSLLADGVARLWRNTGADGDSFAPGGLDLDDRFHPVGQDGLVDERITVLGPAAEGQRSFLLSALRPGSDHYVMRDTVLWLNGFWQVAERRAPGGSRTLGAGIS